MLRCVLLEIALPASLLAREVVARNRAETYERAAADGARNKNEGAIDGAPSIILCEAGAAGRSVLAPLRTLGARWLDPAIDPAAYEPAPVPELMSLELLPPNARPWLWGAVWIVM